MARRARDVCVTERKRFTLLSPRLSFLRPFFFPRFPRLNECARSPAWRACVSPLCARAYVRASCVCVRCACPTFTTCIGSYGAEGNTSTGYKIRVPPCRPVGAGSTVSDIAGWDGGNGASVYTGTIDRLGGCTRRGRGPRSLRTHKREKSTYAARTIRFSVCN